MIRDRQEIERRLYLDFRPVPGMYHRFTLGEAVGRIRVGGPVPQQVGIIGQVAVRVGIAPEQLVGKIRSLNRHEDNSRHNSQAGYPSIFDMIRWRRLHGYPCAGERSISG